MGEDYSLNKEYVVITAILLEVIGFQYRIGRNLPPLFQAVLPALSLALFLFVSRGCEASLRHVVPLGVFLVPLWQPGMRRAAKRHGNHSADS